MIHLTAQKRLVVVGSMGPKVGCSLDIADDFGNEDEWRASMDSVVDATPELSDEWLAARLEEQIDGLEDNEWWARGQW